MNFINAKNVPEIYQDSCREFENSPVVLTRRNGKYQALTYGDLHKKSLYLATALIDLGLELLDNVAILADNREEWIISEFAIKYAGCVDVPRGTDATDQDISYILTHAEVEYVFVENEAMFKRIKNILNNLPKISHIIIMQEGVTSKNEKKVKIYNLYDLIETGKELREKNDRRSEDRVSKITRDDLFALIYTSGTTGNPKGVALTHGNLISQVEHIPIKFFKEDRFLSILPIWHIFERTLEMVSITVGASTYYTNVRNIREDMLEVKPTTMASAPRLWENVYLGILKKINAGPKVAQVLFKMAYFCSRQFQEAIRFMTFKKLDLVGRNPLVSFFIFFPYNLLRAILFFLPFKLLDFIVLSKIRKATGGKLRMSVSGGGALPLHIDEFFNYIGIPILEGYGMTETSPVISARTMNNLVIGSVGPIWPNTELRLIDVHSGELIYPSKTGTMGRGIKGEIHVRGPQVMRGYHKDPTSTSKVLKDGWMNTGDLGLMTFNNCLKIVGRTKETIVLLGGENVEPTPIEGKLIESPMIEQCMITGQDQKYLTCLIVPSIEYFGSDHEVLSKDKEVYQKIMQELKTIVSTQNGFKGFEKIVDCRLLPKPFVVGDEINNSFKLKRHVVAEKYEDLIKSMY